MVNRRDFLGITAGAGATLALNPQLLRALQSVEQQGGTLIKRAIPSSGELLPIISVASRSGEPAALKGVLKTFVDNGGRVFDTLHGGPPGEEAAGKAANDLALQTKLFWSTVISVNVPTLPGYVGPTPKVDPAAVRAQVDAKLALFNVPKIDLVMVGANADLPTHFAVLREMKKEGRIRYIGVHTLLPPAQFPIGAVGAQLEGIMRNEQIDFIGADYSVGDRRLEDRILPLALERKIGVMAYFPFDRRRIFERASSTPLPDWAAEFDAKTWAQFFLKYVISHPAITAARVGTTSAAHMLDDIGGGIGRLPNEATRKRMAQLVDSFPPTPAPAPPQPQQQGPQSAPIALPAATLDRYVGEYNYVAVGQSVTFRRDGEKLLMKIQGNVPEGALIARSETRFQGPFGLIIEFQPDGQGKVSNAMVEQGPFRIPLVRKQGGAGA